MGIKLHSYLGPYIECPYGPNSPHRYDVVDDMLFTIDSDDQDKLYLAPNVRRDGDPRPDVDIDEAGMLDLQGVKPAAEIEWLKTAFAPEIELLRKAYGDVKFHWGLCRWWA